MATRAIFVGVNKHRDTTIPELGGARRDATALWALFTDTIEGLSAHLLVDERATHADVSGAIFGALDSAEEEDVVIVGFAGHGSPDGSFALVAMALQPREWRAQMSDALVEFFKNSKLNSAARVAKGYDSIALVFTLRPSTDREYRAKELELRCLFRYLLPTPTGMD
jgi:hypothetical protein